MAFEDWQTENKQIEPGGFETWKTGLRKEPTAIEKVGQYYKEAVAAPVRTIESMMGSVGGLIRMGAEAATIGRIISRFSLMPGSSVMAEHLTRKYGTGRAMSFYHRKMEKLADAGKKIQDFWGEQANKGWEAPNPDIVEARWSERPLSKGVSVIYSGLTSIGVVLGTTYLTKSPHAGLAILAASETGGMYSRLRDDGVSPNVASKLAQMAGAWTYVTEKIGFKKLLAPSKRSFIKMLKKPGWEGAQEVVEGMGHNLLEYFGYDYRKPSDIPTAIKAAVDHMMDGWVDNLVGGIGAGGIVSVAMPGARPGPDTPITTPPTIEELTKKPIEEIEPQTPDHVIGHQYGLTNEQVDSKLDEAELRYRELKLKETDERTPTERDELAFFSRNRTNIEAILERETRPGVKQVKKPNVPNEIIDLAWEKGEKKWSAHNLNNNFWNWYNRVGVREAANQGIRISKDWQGNYYARTSKDSSSRTRTITQPIAPPTKKIKRTQKNLLVLGHKIARQAELTDEEYRDFAEIVTDKRSMKDMSKAERNEFVAALEESYGTPKELLPEDYDIPINVAGRATSMRKIFNEVTKTLETLTPRRKIPAIIKMGFGEESVWQRAKNFAVGIDNTPVYHLARKLDNGIEGIFSEVLDKGIQHGVEIANGHERQVTEALLSRLQELGVTDSDLAKMGRSVNPRLRTHQMISEGADAETFVETINNQDYKLTWANLIHIYLYSNQKAGMRHIKGGGLVIYGNMTGKISEERINDMRQKVEGNPKAKAVADTILEIGEKIWKPSINMVSMRTEGKEIATEPNWFGLRIFMPPKLAGKIRVGKMGQFGVNFIEDKGMFHDRTKSTLPLIVGDAFSEFTSFENATADYVGMAEAARTSRTLLNNPDIATALDQKGYGQVRHHILAIHKQAQSLPITEGNFSAFFAKRLPALYRAVLHFNPRLVASQKTSTFNYGAYVSLKYMKNVVAGNWKNIQRTLRLSNIAWDRFHMAHSSLALGEMAQSDAVLRMWTGGKSSDINKMGWAIKMADGSALADGMKMAQEEYQDARKGTIEGLSAEWWANKDVENMPKMNIEMWEEIQAKEEDATPEERQATEQWKKLVVKRAEYLWQRTQPSWDKWNRSYLTSQKGLRRVYLLFRSFHEKSLTIFNEAKMDYGNSAKTLDDKAIFSQKAGAVLTGYTVNKFLRLAMAALLYRERKSLVKIGEELLTSWMDMFPVFGKALKITVNRFIDTLTGEKTSYVGEALESFPVRVVNMALKAPPDMAEAVAHLLKGENKEAEEAFMRGLGRFAENVGMLHGYPVPEAKRFGTWLEEEEEPESKRGPARRPPRRRPG